MRRLWMLLLPCLPVGWLQAQKIQQGFDFAFKPTPNAPRYYVTTEKQDSLWHREAYYLPEMSMAMEAWYLDSACKKAHGPVNWFHMNKTLRSSGRYVAGKKEGMWVEYHDNRMMRDSGNYVQGKLKGVRLQWHPDGSLVDSMNFDGQGSGVEVSWDEQGRLYAAGHWMADTMKMGRWKYYHPNGQVLAIEDFMEGKRTAFSCYDSTGNALDTALCRHQEARFPGGLNAWRRFLERTLQPDVPVKKGAPVGAYTVVMQFIVDRDGRVSKIEPLTRFGFGMEEEAARMLGRVPQWEPARQFGRPVRAFRRQPITFVVSR